MPASESSALRLVASAFAAIPIGFGINAFVRPDHALSFFEFEVPTSPAERDVVNSLMVVYGARDIFMGLALFSALWFGHAKSVGWILVSFSAVAFVDGYVCWTHGQGEWTHWGYAPILTVIGAAFLGLFDRR
ncbi:hypothetical protein BDV23DRAFT_81632 [Aspergillus alliaceus]|uniref:Integral membrane protein n=1 Tax=Petromyces alliaceus TaxID=209559 RepID=A0A5N7CNX2_PETAA|nr:hypothetical protein BDV23DRAFT_81632 [Aspergillus alliaceus]